MFWSCNENFLNMKCRICCDYRTTILSNSFFHATTLPSIYHKKFLKQHGSGFELKLSRIDGSGLKIPRIGGFAYPYSPPSKRVVNITQLTDELFKHKTAWTRKNRRRLTITFTSNGKRELVRRDYVSSLLFNLFAPKLVVSRNFLFIRIVLSCFYLLIFYFEKSSVNLLPYTWSLY